MILYVCQRYSTHPEGEFGAFEQACKRARVLAEAGLHFFSPIVHSHPVDYTTLGTLRIQIASSDALLVFNKEDEVSKGVAMEVEEAHRLNIPVIYTSDQGPWVVQVKRILEELDDEKGWGGKRLSEEGEFCHYCKERVKTGPSLCPKCAGELEIPGFEDAAKMSREVITEKEMLARKAKLMKELSEELEDEKGPSDGPRTGVNPKRRTRRT